MTEALKEKSFSNNIKKLLSKAKIKEFFSKDTKKKISTTLSKKVFIYLGYSSIILEYEFILYLKTPKYFYYVIISISRYINNGKLFKEK